MSTIYFANAVQKTLFACELSGQISDGKWENSIPHSHWKAPCGADLAVDTANPRIVGFRPSRSYNFADVELVDIVGDRMLTYARARIMYPNLSDDTIDILDYGDHIFTSGYYGKQLEELAAIGVTNHAELRELNTRLATEVAYNTADLFKDLKAIGKIFREARR